MKTDSKTMKSLRERNRERTRLDLMDAALSTFADVGYGPSAVEEIAKRAGTSKGTLYAYFPEGRDGLFRDVYAQISADVLQRCADMSSRCATPEQSLVAIASGVLDVCSEPRKGRFFMIDGPGLGAVLAPVLGKTSLGVQRLIIEALEKLRRDGRLKPGTNSEIIALLFDGAIRSGAVAISNEPEMRTELLEGLSTFVEGLLIAS